jgi:hypothetical protein
VAMPRRRGAFYIFGRALGAAFSPINPKAKPEPGHSPGIIWLLSAGHSHRREANSGGKAEVAPTEDF